MATRHDGSIGATGYGLVTPFGVGVAAALAGVKTGVSRVLPDHLDGVLPVLAARVPEDASSRPAERFLQLAVEEAVADARIDPSGVAFFVGTCSGEMRAFERWLAHKPLPDDPTRDWYEAPGRAVARELGLMPPLVFTSACTSALTALHAAAGAIARGEIERAVVAGTDALCVFAASGFVTLKATSDAPARPFARDRNGLSFGEGAAALVLERDAARDVRLILHGTGLSADAKHITAPRADALGLEQAARAALRDRSFDLYVAHGTGTQANDAMELVLGRRLSWQDKPWLAHKGLLGHAMGASGLISLVLANEQMLHGIDSPPSYGNLEPGVLLGGPVAGTRTALVAAAAFGGSNAAAYWERG